MGISIWQLVIILLIIVLLFGSKKIRSLGGDLGSALRGFKKEMGDDEKKEEPASKVQHKEDADFSKQSEAEKQEQDKRD
ncbi:twin-arginine translocase subunit TatA [Aliidiomarina minuta]|uniref:Sec-independent protein translocase protein TatA n=1 Tax=Aliidiomarina minuta TaxID=880057 RepID=A0A432W3Y1_9GAMM|nr:twin-arginine translocase TatA/TatE family subunit [Aliidiomarina minuta]RUO24006.1 twin-arginine translocase subunit TatA [Aliidiomarina minuta]